jgi:hypothetical protein
MCDDVSPLGGDLDWEFALFRALGIRPVICWGGLNGQERQTKM